MRYCLKCKKDVNGTEVNPIGFHLSCDSRTVPLWSEERQKYLKDKFKVLEEENESLKEMNEDLTELLGETSRRLAHSSCPHAIVAMAWITEAHKK